MKENIRAAAIAVILVAAGLFFWHLADLADCREFARKGALAGEFPKSLCSQTGSRSTVFLFALLTPLSSSAAAEQQGNTPRKFKAQKPQTARSLAVYLVPAGQTP